MLTKFNGLIVVNVNHIHKDRVLHLRNILCLQAELIGMIHKILLIYAGLVGMAAPHQLQRCTTIVALDGLSTRIDSRRTCICGNA